ncbi:MAG: 2-aminoethylphosphonate--pyruvate transaminase, partial [Helicobacteraceae bacterium]|nr:2-aminoethylphosphonate--pyruvate transaminase [Helicobacteraceae bacterium]
MRNILLNPGPANTALSVKMAQVVEDVCPREVEFSEVLSFVSESLVEFVEDFRDSSAVIFGGSGTLAIESALSSIIGDKQKVAIIKNGAYGERLLEIAKAYKMNFCFFESSPFYPLDFSALSEFIKQQKPTHLALVHCETTSGLINSLFMVSKICKAYGVKIICDCISSFGVYPISLKEVDFVIATSNKCLQGMAGVSFVIAKDENLKEAKYAKSLYLDLKAQWEFFKQTKQMRFTPPVQVIYALKQALLELRQEGQIRRYHRYLHSNLVLRGGLEKLGFECLPIESYSVIIASVKIPTNIDFNVLHSFCKDRGFVIYPSKVGEFSHFRVANIGDIDFRDIENFIEVFKRVFKRGKIVESKILVFVGGGG